MTVHVQVWLGSGSARITDMTNAGKKGKTCRVLRFNGFLGLRHNAELNQAYDITLGVLELLKPGRPIRGQNFDTACALVNAEIDQARAAGVSEHLVATYLEEVRGVDAPLPLLVAGNDKWSGKADETGVFLRDLTDLNNEPAMTNRHGQKNSQAYKLAAKVWGQMAGCKTMHEASEVLSAAGVKLHYWCMVD